MPSRLLKHLRPIHTRGFAPGACSRLILHVSVHMRERFAPGACSQIFNRLNIVEHFEILLPRMKYTHEIIGTHGGALLPERAPGACSGSKTARVYRPLMSGPSGNQLVLFSLESVEGNIRTLGKTKLAVSLRI